jgi:hypothetical protein
MRAVEALRAAAVIFDRYATLHKAKGTPDGDAKAAANREAVMMCHLAISTELSYERKQETERALLQAERDAFLDELVKQKPAVTAIFDRAVWDAVAQHKVRKKDAPSSGAKFIRKHGFGG